MFKVKRIFVISFLALNVRLSFELFLRDALHESTVFGFRYRSCFDKKMCNLWLRTKVDEMKKAHFIGQGG